MKRKDVTAYSLYHVQQYKRTKINPLKDVFPDLPNKKYQIIYISYDPDGDTDTATLRDEDGTTWNFPLSTLYCCGEFVQSVITQPTVSFEELFGKDE